MSKAKDSAATLNAVLDYLNKQNRPYSVIDVVNNLHNEHGKTAVQKAVEQLAETGKIKEKVYGKQKVYVADQSQFPDVNDGEIKQMDANILELSEKLKTLQQGIRTSESELNSLSSTLTTEEQKQQITKTTEEIKRLKAKLHELTSSSNHISPAVKEKICKDNEKTVKEWRKRKRMAMDVVNAILEGYPKGKKALLEEVGMETDEDVGVTLPQK